MRKRPVREIAKDVGISESCLRNWKQRGEIDRAFRPVPEHLTALTDRPTGCVFASDATAPTLRPHEFSDGQLWARARPAD